MSVLRRRAGWPEDHFSEVAPEWVGETVALLGGGPSLTQEQVARVVLAGLKIVAVNDAYLLAPVADVCYFADSSWWEWHSKGISKPAIGMTAEQVRERFESFSGQKCTIQYSGENVTDPKVHMLRNTHFPDRGFGLSLDPERLVTGRNSGFQALNLAVLAGSRRVLLLGYDGRPDADGKAHWFGEHPRPTPAAAYAEYRKSFSVAEAELLKAGVEVVNCSPGSYIDSFPKVNLKDALNG